MGEETNRTNLVSGPDFLARARKKKSRTLPESISSLLYLRIFSRAQDLATERRPRAAQNGVELSGAAGRVEINLKHPLKV